MKAKVLKIDEETVHFEIEGQLRFESEYVIAGSRESPVPGGVIEFDFHPQDSLCVLIRDGGNGT